MRKTREELDQIMKDHNTDRLWSYSRVSSYQNCSYSYYLKYVKKIKETIGGVYLDFGTAIHDAMEKFYNKEVPFECINEAFEETKMTSLYLGEQKFNNADEEKNEAIQEKYLACLDHFTKNHNVYPHRVLSEEYVFTTLTADGKSENGVQNEYFIGYIDAMHYEPKMEIVDGEEKDVGGILYITDWKTSTKFAGDKIKKNGNQLILNALGVSQMTGFPLERIRARWDFLKYVTISYEQKNGKIRETIGERHAWVQKIQVNLRARLKATELYGSTEIEQMVLDAINNNNIDNMPEDIRNAYSFDDAYVYVDLSEDNVYNVNNELIEVINEIRNKESKDDESVWVREVTDKDSYFCSQLCGYRDKCPCYKQYIDEKMLFINGEKNEEKEDIKEDNDWLKELGII